ncbi:MAG: MgtC/SapB family protein [Propionibacteriaceae bacterium]|nr:MgtC/SapB family protein [Propionibacteriaceae bacterium]
MGFIGGGAILKYGASILGLTTAGSLWATASVGVAFGSGLYLLRSAVVLLIVFSLWPLNRIIDHVRHRRMSRHRVRLALSGLEVLSDVYARLRSARVEVLGIQSQRVSKSRYEVVLDLETRPAFDWAIWPWSSPRQAMWKWSNLGSIRIDHGMSESARRHHAETRTTDTRTPDHMAGTGRPSDQPDRSEETHE